MEADLVVRMVDVALRVCVQKLNDSRSDTVLIVGVANCVQDRRTVTERENVDDQVCMCVFVRVVEGVIEFREGVQVALRESNAVRVGVRTDIVAEGVADL